MWRISEHSNRRLWADGVCDNLQHKYTDRMHYVRALQLVKLKQKLIHFVLTPFCFVWEWIELNDLGWNLNKTQLFRNSKFLHRSSEKKKSHVWIKEKVTITPVEYWAVKSVINDKYLACVQKGVSFLLTSIFSVSSNQKSWIPCWTANVETTATSRFGWESG